MSAGDSRRRPARFGTAIARVPGQSLALGVALSLASSLALGCASAWVHEGGRFTHGESGLSVASPPGGPWTPVPVEGTTLTLRNPSGSTLTWLRTCRDHPAPARVEAGSLLRGIENVEVSSEGPLGEPAVDGWQVNARVTDGGLERDVRLVTRVVGNCTDDWILVASPGAGLALAGAFDDWWGSVRAPQVAAEAEMDPGVPADPAGSATSP